MCFIYNHRKTQCEPKPTTGFKIYIKLSNALSSPYHADKPSGVVSCGGTKEAAVEEFARLVDDIMPFKVQMPLDGNAHGSSYDLSGFHCLMTREDAETFRHYLASDTSLGDKFRPEEFKIVPVHFEEADVIVLGETPMRSWRVVPTVVVRKITIKQEDFDAAVMEAKACV